MRWGWIQEGGSGDRGGSGEGVGRVGVGVRGRSARGIVYGAQSSLSLNLSLIKTQ